MELGVFDSCLVTEEIAFGCAGIKAALLTSNIGVSGLSPYFKIENDNNNPIKALWSL